MDLIIKEWEKELRKGNSCKLIIIKLIMQMQL